MNGVSHRARRRVATIIIASALLAPAVLHGQDMVELGQWVNGPCRVLAADGTRLYAGNGRALEVMMPDPQGGAALLGRLVLPEVILDLAVADDLVVAACGDGGVSIISIGQPDAPTLLASYDSGGEVRAVATDGLYAYVADHDTGLHVLDLSEPAEPDSVTTVELTGGLSALALEADRLYVGDTDGDLNLYDVIDPAHPWLTDHHGDSGDVYDIAVAGGRAYLAQGAEGLLVIDVSNPLNIDDLGRLPMGGAWAFGVAIEGQQAFVAAAAAGLKIVDVSDPTAMSIVGELLLGGYAYDVERTPLGAAVADSWPGVRLVDLSDVSAPTVSATVLARAYATRVAYTDPYAVVVDADSSLRVLEFDGGSLQEIGSVLLREVRDVAVAGPVAVAACNRFGLQVIDLSDPTRPETAATFDTPGLAVGVCLHEGVAWVADGDGGIFGVDVLTPTSPPTTYAMDVGVDISDVAARDGVLLLGDRDGAIHLVSVVDPAEPTLLGSAVVTGEVRRVAFGEGMALAACGVDGLRVVDISDPEAPSEAGSAVASQEAWDVASVTGYALVADDVAGLHVYDVSDPTDVFTVLVHETEKALGLDVLRQRILVADGLEGVRLLRTQLVVPVVVSDLAAGREGAGLRLSWRQSGGEFVTVVRRDDQGRERRLGETRAGAWFDADAPVGALSYHLETAGGRMLATVAVDAAATLRVRLDPPHPNPANPATVIRFAVPPGSDVRLDICDLRGRRVVRLVDEVLSGGEHVRRWDGRDEQGSSAASGLYLVRLQVDAEQRLQRLHLLR